MTTHSLAKVIKAILLNAKKPLSIKALIALFDDDDTRPSQEMIETALQEIETDIQDDVITLKKLASGYVLQVKRDFVPWISKLTEDKPPRYSRALLETLAIIAYRQPVTRSEIEAIRGVGVSTGIIRTLEEREWVRVIGHRDVVGKPAIYGTTKTFLDYFDCEDLSDLPPIGDIKELTEDELKRIEALIDDATELPEDAHNEEVTAVVELTEDD